MRKYTTDPEDTLIWVDGQTCRNERMLHAQGPLLSVDVGTGDTRTEPIDEVLRPSRLEGKPEIIVEKENRSAIKDSAVLCKFSRSFIGPDRLATLLETDIERIQSVGARIVALERRFNNDRGFDRADDTVPYADLLPGFDDALSTYFEEHGWTDDGIVPPAQLAENPLPAD